MATPRPKTLVTDVNARPVARAVNRFAFRLAREFTDRHPKENWVFSPFSVDLSLATALVGAQGESRNGLAKASGLGAVDADSIPDAFQAIHEAVRSDLHMANEVVLFHNLPVRPGYRLVCEQQLGARLNTLLGSNSGELAEVNAWVTSSTQGRITRIVTEVDPAERMMLASAASFKATWAYGFDRRLTTPGSFHQLGGDRKPAPMMRQVHAPVRYGRIAGCRLVEMDFEGALSAVLVLPEVDASIPAVLDFFAQAWDGTMVSLKDVEIDLSMPRFGQTSSSSLEPHLRSMGAAAAFKVNCDFTPISECLAQCRLGRVLHTSCVSFAETGNLESRVSAGKSEAPFIADHPFIYAIRHKPTGTILFLGLYRDPADTR